MQISRLLLRSWTELNAWSIGAIDLIVVRNQEATQNIICCADAQYLGKNELR